MLADGLRLIEGSFIQNLTVSAGTSLPSSPSEGEIFCLTAGDVGLYVYLSSTWQKVSGTSGGGTGEIITGNFIGPLRPQRSSTKWYPFQPTTITGIFASVGTPSTSDIVFDILKNESSIFGVTKPKILALQNKSNIINTSVSLTPDDYITTSIVSASGGYDLTIFIRTE